MDSLVANYASSDEEEEEKGQNDSSGSLMSSLPPPKAYSLFSSLPQPKNNNTTTPPEQSSSLFQSLPQPKSNSNSSLPPPKRVVQFKPPSVNLDDDDDERDIKEEKQGEALQPSSSSVKSFLSSIPAPRNSSTLGVTPTGSGRRSIIETEPSHSQPLPETPVADVSYESGIYNSNEGYYESGGYSSYEGNYESGVCSSNEGSYTNYDSGSCTNYDSGSYTNYVSGAQSSSWGEGAVFPGRGKRGRNEIPTEIVEVKQDELIKDRPREDQVKLTGIAFGPSYQPVSNKGKPTKLHKRKHQIGSLYFDMKQKEMELQERRAKGFLTKAETQAKYGW